MYQRNRRGDPRAPRRGFTLVELLVVITIIGMLMAMMFPALGTVMDTVYMNKCMNNMRGLGTALQGYQTANGNAWPTVSTEPVNGKPALAAAEKTMAEKNRRTTRPPAGRRVEEKATASGYGWLVTILPQLGEGPTFSAINGRSKSFSRSAFDPQIADDNGRHFSMTNMPLFQCPVFTGTAEVAYTSGAPEYRKFSQSIGDGSGAVALTNYVVLSATHMSLVIPKDPKNPSGPPNGVIYYNAQRKGPTRIPDGDTNTVVLSETREPNYAAWFDGTTSWVVAHDPNTTEPEERGGRFVCDTKSGCNSALNIGPEYSQAVDESQIVHYRKKGTSSWHGDADWGYGPSSSHASGQVVHLYGDKRVVPIQANGPNRINPNVYMAIVTRGGNEAEKYEP